MAKKWLEFRQNSINRKKREFRYAEFTFLAPIPRFYAELNSAAGFASGIRVKGGPIVRTWCGTEAILVGESIYSSFCESHSNVFSPSYGTEILTRKNTRNDQAAIKISAL
jgi:hypothetical protein